MGRRCFEDEGYEVTTFTDSAKALSALGERRFDVVIPDIKMKEVGGLQLL